MSQSTNTRIKRDELIGRMECDTNGLHELLGLAVMAAEADRVLSTLECWESHAPELQSYIRGVDAWSEWSLYRKHVGGALRYMQILSHRLVDGFERLGEVEYAEGTDSPTLSKRGSK